jgi:hypothetical protein
MEGNSKMSNLPFPGCGGLFSSGTVCKPKDLCNTCRNAKLRCDYTALKTMELYIKGMEEDRKMGINQEKVRDLIGPGF